MSTPDFVAAPSKALATFGRMTFVASLALGLAAGLALVPVSGNQFLAAVAIFSVLCAAGVCARLSARRSLLASEHIDELEQKLLKHEMEDRRSYQALVERSIGGFYRTTRDGRFLIANPALARILGYESPEQLIAEPNNVGRSLYVEPKRREEFHALMHTDRMARDFVSQIKRRDGSIIWIAENAQAVVDGDGRLLFYEGTVEDATARRNSEEAALRIMRETRDATRDAARSKSSFLAAMSHELKTPLNAVIGFSDVMRQELFGPVGNERYRSYVDDIHENGRRLLGKINDILDLTRLEGHLMDLEEQNLCMADMVAAAQHAVTEGKKTSAPIELDVPANLPLLRADAKRLRQILVHVLSNAVKFTASGGRIGVAAKIEADGRLAIIVSDTGIGMRPELVNQAMHPFRQLDGRLERNFEGLGLGLPLANALMGLHGGQFTIQSGLGDGTTVSLRFPANRVIRAGKISAA
jgi:PAS domain S-box-containing protein